MSNYVIDENVVRNAWTGKKSDQHPALAEMKLMRDIFFGNQHLAMNLKIRDKFTKWGKQTEQIRSDDVDNLLVPLFIKLIFNAERTILVNGIRTNFRGIKDCDTEFVGVTLQAPNGILVTSDGRLVEAIAADPEVQHCRCVTAEEAISTY